MYSETQPIAPWTLYKEHIAIKTPPIKGQTLSSNRGQSQKLPKIKKIQCSLPRKLIQTTSPNHQILRKRSVPIPSDRVEIKVSPEKPKSSLSVRQAPATETVMSLPFEKERSEIAQQMEQLILLKWMHSELKEEQERSIPSSLFSIEEAPRKEKPAKKTIQDIIRKTQSVADTIHKEKGRDIKEILAKHRTSQTRTTNLKELLFRKAR